ncbi:hypothetical protein BT69DRAFT_1331204 [Atractiella rhizophila]|nr:hypothetical protein BT69DRAFT_1331204 [Atractiella rhizophila]
MEISALFRLVNLVVAAALIVGAVGHFIFFSFSNALIGAYTALFGVLIAATELGRYPGGENARNKLVENWKGWWTFGGRGAAYVLFGVLNLSDRLFLNIAGAIIGFCGVVFLLLSFVNSLTFPGPAAVANPKRILDMTQPIIPTHNGQTTAAATNVQQPQQSYQPQQQPVYQNSSYNSDAQQQNQNQNQPQYGYGYNV